jgi:hypothetical protein
VLVRLLIRIVAVLSAFSVAGTVWFIAAFAAAGGMQELLSSGALGILTIACWCVVLLAGPVAAVQLWRFRRSGRRAGLVLFGTSVLYYGVGLLALRAPEAPVGPIITSAVIFAVPLLVLLAPRARPLFVAVVS